METENDIETIDHYSLLTLPLPRDTISGCWFARLSPGGEAKTSLLLFTKAQGGIIYEGEADSPWSGRRTSHTSIL